VEERRTSNPEIRGKETEMCYVDWMKEDWEIDQCEGTTDLQTQNWLKFVEEDDGNGMKKKIKIQAANALWTVWADGISYSSNGDIVTGQHDGCDFEITRDVPPTGKAMLSCMISGGTSGNYSALVGGGSADFFSALLALFGRPFKALKALKAPKQRRARIHYPGGGSDSGGGSWTALEGGLT
jgi:hypothetical protein